MNQNTLSFVERIRTIRQMVDGYHTALNNHWPVAFDEGKWTNYELFRYTTFAQQHLMEGKMWLGKTLQAVGTDNPYPESHNPDSPVVEPTSDQSTDNFIRLAILSEEIADGDPVAVLKLARLRLKNVIDELLVLNLQLINEIKRPVDRMVNPTTTAIRALETAKMWYGMALQVTDGAVVIYNKQSQAPQAEQPLKVSDPDTFPPKTAITDLPQEDLVTGLTGHEGAPLPATAPQEELLSVPDEPLPSIPAPEPQGELFPGPEKL